MKTRRQFLTQTLKGIACLSSIAFLGMKGWPEAVTGTSESDRAVNLPLDLAAYGNTMMFIGNDGTLRYIPPSDWSETWGEISTKVWDPDWQATEPEEKMAQAFAKFLNSNSGAPKWSQLRPTTRGQG